MKKYYYEMGFYNGEKATEESLRIWGDTGFTWYLKSDAPLTKEEILATCLREHKDVSGYDDLVKAIPYCDCVNEISGDEFESCCSVSQ